MKTKLYIQCPDCLKRLTLKRISTWVEKPFCEKCNKEYSVYVSCEDMSITIEAMEDK